MTYRTCTSIQPESRGHVSELTRLGGGDLDGDGKSAILKFSAEADIRTDFTLIWDQRFVKPLRPYEAMNYTAPPPLRVDKVSQTDLNEVSYSNLCVGRSKLIYQNFVQYILVCSAYF